MYSPVDEIKARIDIVDLVNSYVRLQKAGVNFRACCPFHNEKTPSFFVTPARQMWHCFGCGKGGDMFAFLMDIEGYDFPEALKVLGDRAGVEVKKEDPKQKSERVRLIALLDEAASFFETQLAGNTIAREYLLQRGLREETISEFRVGYVPDEWKGLFQHLSEKGFAASEMERAGLLLKSSSGNYFDRFRGRIMFPIADYSGRVVGFGGRVFPEREKEAKYVNSPETPLYQKSKILYGLHKAKSDILRSETCIIVEGYMDMLMAYQAGTKNVVASSGTALTAEQVHMLRRLSRSCVVAFDMDAAGEHAARRGIDLALKENFEVRVARLGEHKDPADAIAKDPAVWTSAVEHAVHIVRFYLDLALRRHAPRTPELSRAVQATVLPVVSSLASELERAHWSKELSAVLGIKEEIIWEAQKSFRASPTNSGSVMMQAPVSQTRSRKELLEDRVLGMVAKYPRFLDHNKENPVDTFFSGDKKMVLTHLRRGAEDSGEGRSPLHDFVSRLMLEAELFLEGVADAEAEFVNCRRELEREYLRERLQGLSARIALSESHKDGESSTLMAEFKTVSDTLARL